MAYIGREPQIGNYQICDAISVVNGQAAYTMQVSSVNVIPESVNHMIVSLNGVIQKPGSSYTISSSTITFSSNLATGDSIDFIYLLGNVLDLGVPSDSTVTTAKLGADAVTGAKIADDAINSEHYTDGSIDTAHIADANVTTAKIADTAITTAKIAADAITEAKIADDAISDEHLDPTAITGQTAETSIATDDLILISDTSASGALKKMTRANFVSGVGGTNTPAFQAYASAQSGITDNTATKVDFDTELFDTDGCYDTSNKRFLPTTAGKYYIYAVINFDAQGTDKFHSGMTSIYKNGSYYKHAYFDEYDNYLSYAKSPFVGAAIDFNGSSDYVEVYATFNITSGTNHRLTGGAYSSFGGFKIIGA